MTAGSSAAELADLVAEARRPIADELQAAVGEVSPSSYFDSEPAPQEAWFPELVRRTTAEVQAGDPEHQALLESARSWSYWVLGPGQSPSAYEELATGHAIAQLVDRRTMERPADCAAAIVRGDGLRVLAGGTGVMTSVLHSGVEMAMSAVCLRAAAGRLMFTTPWGPPEGGPLAPSPGMKFRAAGAARGIRFVGPRRLFEVYRQLLREGEICGLPADAPGVTNSTLLGRPVRTSRAPAGLAKSAEVPLLVIASFWDEAGFEVRSEALDSTEFPSVDALHAAQMELIDGWLRDHPEQLVTRFPAAELSRLLATHRAVSARLDRATEAERTATAAAASMKESMASLQQGAAPKDVLVEARRNLQAAKQECRAARVSYREIHTEERRIRAEIRRGPDADRRSAALAARD